MPSLDQVALVLGDPIRLQILDLLAAGRDEACCSPDNPEAPAAVCSCDLLISLGDIAPSRLSYHMKELRKAGLVQEQKRGRWIYYTLNREALSAFVGSIVERFFHKQGCCQRGTTTTDLPEQSVGPCQKR